MSDAVISFTGNAQRLISEYDKLEKAKGKLELGLQRIKKASREAGEAGAKMSQGTKQAIEATVTAAEKYRSTMTGLRAALESGRISEEKYQKARQFAQQTYKKATTDLEALAAAERKHTALLKEGETVTLRTRTATEKYATEVARLNTLRKQGAIDGQTHARAIQAERDALEGATEGAHGFTVAISGIAAAIGGIVAIAQALKAEYELLLEREKATAAKQVNYAEQLRRSKANFAPDATMKAEDLDKRFEKIQKSQNVRDRGAIARVFGSASSARGQRSNDFAAEATDAAFEYAGDDEDTARAMAGRIMDISKQTGSKDVKAIRGFLVATQQAARIENPQQLGKQGAPAILGAFAHGASPEESAELFATVNALLSDEEGANSKTATLQLTGQLMDEKKIAKAGLTKAFKGKGVMDRLAMLQGDSKLADKFMKAEGISFEVAAEPFINKLVSGAPDAMEVYKAAKDTIPSLGPAAAAAGNAVIADMNAGPEQIVNQADRAAEGNSQSAQLADKLGGLSGQANEIFEKTIKQIDLPGFDEPVDIPFVTGPTNFIGLPVRVPGQRDIMRGNVAINRKFRNQGGAQSVASTLGMMAKGGMFSELGGNLSEPDKALVQAQLLEVQKLALEEQKLLRKAVEEQNKAQKANAAAAAVPAAPVVPLLSPSGGDRSLDRMQRP